MLVRTAAFDLHTAVPLGSCRLSRVPVLSVCLGFIAVKESPASVISCLASATQRVEDEDAGGPSLVGGAVQSGGLTPGAMERRPVCKPLPSTTPTCSRASLRPVSWRVGLPGSRSQPRWHRLAIFTET